MNQIPETEGGYTTEEPEEAYSEERTGQYSDINVSESDVSESGVSEINASDENASDENIAEISWRKGYRKGYFTGSFVVLLFAGIFLAGWYIASNMLLKKTENRNSGARVLTESDTLRKLGEIEHIIEEQYLNEVDSELLSSYMFKGIAAGLDDMYANYYSAEELSAVTDSNQGGYFGLGATISQDRETHLLQITEIYEGSPASECGLMAGDELRALNDESLQGKDLSEVVTLIKSQKEDFRILVYRPSEEKEIELTASCGEVEMRYVRTEMVTDTVGYLQIREFTANAVDQFRIGIADLQEMGMEQLVVDLRDNPGGLLTAVCEILDQILPGNMIVYTESRDGSRTEYYAETEGTLDCPIAVLVNGNSASASEIFSGALQDWKKGVIVGTKTFGKGIVQKTYTLRDGSAFKLTAEKYYTPNGQDIHGNGIQPDYVVEQAEGSEEDTVLEKAIEILTGRKTAAE